MTPDERTASDESSDVVDQIGDGQGVDVAAPQAGSATRPGPGRTPEGSDEAAPDRATVHPDALTTSGRRLSDRTLYVLLAIGAMLLIAAIVVAFLFNNAAPLNPVPVTSQPTA